MFKMGARSSYICSACGGVQVKWSGRCASCGAWGTLDEAAAGNGSTGAVLAAESITEISRAKSNRLKTGIGELDLVLGGGIVSGSVILVSGEPGIGKSTLLMQMSQALAKTKPVLYVTGEESAMQVAARARRLGIAAKSLKLAASNSTDDIARTIAAKQFALVVVDSIQTIASASLSANPGLPSQISFSAQQLIGAAKRSHTAVVLVGHITKEGAIAGPKLLEHLVDVVLNLEGDRSSGFKLLRSAKNRYGPTNETGVFEMGESGLNPVKNPSAALLSERQQADGSIVTAAMEGHRPMLIEIQALVTKTSFGYPKRAASGFDYNRLNLLIAMLSRRTKLNLADKDVYINVVGGIKVNDPSADLAVCMAIGSAAKGLKLKDDAVVFGEVGLSGEIRRVFNAGRRLKEAKKLKFQHIIGPPDRTIKDSAYHAVGNIREALNRHLGN